MKRLKKWLSMVLVLGILFSNINTGMALADEVTEDATHEEPGDIDLSDIPALFDWMDEVLPKTVEAFEEKPQEWWDSLLPNQKVIAEGEYAFRRSFGNDGHAEEVDESLDGYIARLEAGEDATAMFAGTIYEGLDLESLKEIKAEGLTLEDLVAMRESISIYAGDKAYLTTQWENFGGGRINRKFLDGADAFCFNEEKKFPNGASYSMVTADKAGFTGRAAYIVEFYGKSGETNSHWWNECQVAVWAVQAGCDTYDQGAAYAAAYCRERGITDSWYVSDYMDIVGKLVDQSRGQSGSCYVYKADDPANQDIAVYAPIWPAYEPEEEEPEYDSVSASAEKSVSITHSISINNKHAAITGESLAGVVFEVYEDNVLKGTITTDASGKGSLSWQVSATKSSTKSETYCSNYDELSNEQKAKVTGYKNRNDAYNAALSAAQAEASALANTEMGKNRTVKIVEKEAPFGYTLTSSSTQTVTLNGSTVSASVSVANNPWKAKLIIDKVNGATGERIEAETVFALYEWNGSAYEVSRNYDIVRMSDGTYTVKGKYQQAEQGYLYYTRTNQGKFGLAEITAPDEYYLDSDVWYFTIEYDGQVIYGRNLDPSQYPINDETKFADEMVPQPEYAEISATATKEAKRTHQIKVDKKYAAITGESLAGAVFEVYEDGQLIGTITTDENGLASISWEISESASATYTKTYCSNYEELEEEEKGEAALVTEYFSKEAAYAAALALAEADAQMQADALADAERIVTVEEVTVPNGFILTDDFKQETTLAGNDEHTISVENIPWKAKLLIDKVDGECGERIPDTTEFILYEWNGDSYVVSENYEIIRLEDGTYTVATIYTDGEEGYLYYTQHNEGKFGLAESKAPEGYVLDPEVFYFRITADGEVFYGHNVNPDNYEIYDDTKFANRKTRHIFTKSDFTSQVLLSEAVLEVLEITGTNPDGSYITEKVDSWVSDKDEIHYFYETFTGVLVEIEGEEYLPEGEELVIKYGHLIKGLKVGVSYLFREITAPYGYVGYDWMDDEVREENREENLAVEEIRFTVRDSHLIAEHQMMDQRAVGKLTVTKEGEFVVDADKTITDEEKDFFYTAFSYVLGRVKNAQFEVYVKDTIYTPDQTETIATYDGVRLVKDALVATITTDETGVAVLDKLPLGTYYVVEVGAGDGDFLLNETVTDVALEYEGQEVAVVINDSTKYENARQKVKLTVTKKSRFEDEYKHLNTGEKVPEEEKDIALPGAVFGLFNAEDIVGFEINAGTGVVSKRADALLAADTLIEKMVTGEDGSATFVSDLPCGKYYIKELQAPDGYFLSEEVYEFDASYTGHDGEDTIVLTYDFYNKPVIVTFDKIDTGSGNPLASCDLQVVDEDGNVIDAWRTDGTLHYIKGLKLNKTYILQETDPEDGWCKADDIPFTVTQAKDPDGNLLDEVELVIDKKHLIDGVITMKNDRVTITVVKYDEKGNMLPGCTLKLEYSDQGTLKTIRIWRTDGQPTFFDKMRPGTYRLTELVAPDGYSVAPPIQFEVGDTERNYGVIMKNSKVPFTGDNSPLALSALGVFAGLLGMAVVVRRRREFR